MTDIKLLSIDETDISMRSKNALHRSGIHTVEDLLECTEEQLSNIPQFGKKSIQEVLELIRSIQPKETSDSLIPFTETNDGKKLVEKILCSQATRTDVLFLSPSSYNILTLAGYEQLHQFIFMTEDELMHIEGMNERCAREIKNECECYLRENSEKFSSFSEQKTDGLSALDVFSDEKDRKAVLDYAKVNDIAVSEMAMSTRPKNRLLGAGYASMSDMIFMTRKDVENLGGLGPGSMGEIFEAIDRYYAEHRERMQKYIEGDSSALIDDEGIAKLILKEYHSLGFGGLSVSELCERLEKKVSVPEERIKKALGLLIADNELEYVDYRCYKVYTKFSDYFRTAKIDERKKAIISGCFEGKTLDEIGALYEFTRERARQLRNRGIQEVKEQYAEQTGGTLFDEDYYVYFYTTYDFDRKDGARWLGISDDIRSYIEMIGAKKGTLPLVLALKDTQNLEAGLRMKIKNYLNRNKIYIDGKWVEKNRAALESVVIKKCCSDELTFTEFADIFNQFLENEGIPYSEDIYYTKTVISSRRNRFMEDRNILWKRGEKIRYYDIDGQDYTEFFETLNLDSYHDIELSAEKFMMEYPDLMEKYDIRDGYELHNLLKKVLETDRYGQYDGLKFAKMPTLRFGTPDRDGDMKNIMMENVPIKAEDLYELIHKEYGYDLRQIPFYLSHLSEYFHQGIYSIDQKEMSDERMMQFKSVLTEDFYTFEDLKRIYCKTFADADVDEINSRNLKRMGFVVNSKYVVQHYSSATKYFEAKLTEADMFDISSLRSRYSAYVVYHQVYLDLKKRLEIVEYEPDQFINFRKLEQGGLTKDMVKEFCDAVYEAAEDGKFFTVRSLCRNGFESELFDFGFEDLFYGSLLISDERFFFQKLWGAMFLCKDKKEISAKNLIVEIVKRERKIDFYDLETLLREEYGCKTIDKSDCIWKTKDAEIFYDNELQIFYADEELYYQEIDDAEGFY